MGPLESSKYGEHFHELYVNCLENRKSSGSRGSRRRRRNKNRVCVTSNHDQLSTINRVEILPNASKFAVFSAIRAIVMESESKSQTLFDILENSKQIKCHQSNKSQDADTDGESFIGDMIEKQQTQPLSQIVGAGLKGLFELVAEARNISPHLCTKGLRALFDVIQGQVPESFKSEPNDLIQQLYDLLLSLATMHGGMMTQQDSLNELSNWSSVACSALLGLCVARGDTGKTLKAISALIMSSKILSEQNIQLPVVLATLQRSVNAVALGKPSRPDYFANGIPRKSLVDEFSIKAQMPTKVHYHVQPSTASNGKHLYVLCGKCLYKIGTGLNGTLKGYVYNVNAEFCKEKSGWIGFCGNNLLYKKISKRNNETVFVISTETLTIASTIQVTMPPCSDGQNCVLFSDGTSLNAICSIKEDSLVVRQLYTVGCPQPDLMLQLARKSVKTFGYTAFEEELLNQQQLQKIQSSFNSFEMKLPNEFEIGQIVCGKEFGLIRAVDGKVYYYGKSTALGLKSAGGKTPTMKPIELMVAKSSNIIHATIGHDGMHAILINEDGNVYFAGTARRGEDGDSSKNRRQPKAVKPKRIAKIEGHVIVHASCNNGTSALVTSAGKLIMLGKDTMHCDSSGFISDLLDHQITKVALGKAHTVALNNKGEIFTFGMNNKGQCGRVVGKSGLSDSEAKSQNAQAANNSNVPPKFDTSNMCDFEEHQMSSGKCRVCTICCECTGYNVSCVMKNIFMGARVPGSNCPCGNGDEGCSKCGACSTCVSFQEPDGVADAKETKDTVFTSKQRSRLARSKERRHLENQIQMHTSLGEVDRDTQRVSPLPPEKVVLPTSSPVIQIACGLHHTVILTQNGEVFSCGSNQHGQLGTGDLLNRTGPIQVKINSFIVQISAGSNHTVLLSSRGVVYTFGSHSKGQLGRLPHDMLTNISFLDEFQKSESNDDSAADISNLSMIRQKFLWNCSPGPVSGIGPQYGKRATMIYACGDQTFLKIDESILTGLMLSKINVVADKSTILLIPQIPMSFNCLSISRRDGSCIPHSTDQVNFAKMTQHNMNAISRLASDKCNRNIDMSNDRDGGREPPADQMSQSVYGTCHQVFDEQENLQFSQHHHEKEERRPVLDLSQLSRYDKIVPQLAFEMDTYFGILWVFDAIEKKCLLYNVIASEAQRNMTYSNHVLATFKPEIMLPNKTDMLITRNLATVNLLGCLDVLTSIPEAIPSCFEQTLKPSGSAMKDSVNMNDFQTVTRFENLGGGWGYSGQSVEAIRFMADTDIVLIGFGMYGGRGEYTCKLKLYDLGMEGGGYEKDGTLLIETEEIPFECPARNKFNIFLPKTVNVYAGRWYLVTGRISGPSSDCGSDGLTSVTTEDQIVFNFRTSKKANNGTDVKSGQIPSILYHVINQDSKLPMANSDVDPIYRVSHGFANSVTKDCFQSLITLLRWSWGTFKLTLNELKDKKCYSQSMSTCHRLYYISRVCLRLLRKYTNEIYPNNMSKEDTAQSKKRCTDSNDQSDAQSNVPGTAAAVVIKQRQPIKAMMSSSLDVISSSTNQKRSTCENLRLAESVGDVRALLIDILCDEIALSVENEGFEFIMDIFDECHTTFLSCFNAFYPTNVLKWNCLCDLLMKRDKGIMHARLLSAILAGLCDHTVKLRMTFPLFSSNRESMSIISPSDNSGLPMLSSTENYLFPVLVEQMTYRTQLEKNEYPCNSWTFNDVLVRLLDIIAYPIKIEIENNTSRLGYTTTSGSSIHPKLIDNCCHLLARVLSEVIFESNTSESDTLPVQSIRSTGCRFARRDPCRTWNTGNFGPDAICFSVDRSDVAIAGVVSYSGSGSYEYQLELLYDTLESPAQHKWETLESVSGTYDQDIVQNDMVEIRFSRPAIIKENTRYAIRLCLQGARTCSGDNGYLSLRGPCGAMFSFYPCELSFNGTTPQRGQIPCLLYYSSTMKPEAINGKIRTEMHARDTALKISSDITKKCTDLLILARNILSTSHTPSENSGNSSLHTQTLDSEQNITPIEEHFDITFANNTHAIGTPAETSSNNLSRDITKRIESFSKGIMETLKLDKRLANPFECEIEIGATEIHPKDLAKENELTRSNGMLKVNGNNVPFPCSGKSPETADSHKLKILDIFEHKTSSMFHTLLPITLGHIAVLANGDPRSSVYVMSLIREILPHVSALNKLSVAEDEPQLPGSVAGDESIGAINAPPIHMKSGSSVTTSNHYCIVESDHPYKAAAISNFRVEFPACVQWFTIEFDPLSGTAQPEDYLLISIPKQCDTFSNNAPTDSSTSEHDASTSFNSSDLGICKNARLTTSTDLLSSQSKEGDDWFIAQMFNKPSNWTRNAIILPGNKLNISLETATNYARDQNANSYGFKCLIVGYDSPALTKLPNLTLNALECELAYLGGMCSSSLLRKNLILPGENPLEDYSSIEKTIETHSAILSKGLALSGDSVLSISQALDSYLPVGDNSNERQFLKDFVGAVPGSTGARLAMWLQPESRLDPNKCELIPISETIRFGWPTHLTIITRDQYGDPVYVPNLMIQIKASPANGINGNRKGKRLSQVDNFNVFKSDMTPPRIPYEATNKDKMCFKAITFMKQYQQYSFEELRFCSPTQSKGAETLYAKDSGDYSYGTIWTPSAVGHFSLSITIDGDNLEEVYRVEVKEAGNLPPPQKSLKKSQPQKPLRKFRGINSAGLRIRSHPTLQSEQVGIIKQDGIISYIDEVENDDGLWVRLSTESIRQHCQPGWYPFEAWALQFNQHVDKTLLYPVHSSRANSENLMLSDSNEDILDDSLATPISDAQHLFAPDISTPKKKAPIDATFETNPFRALARDGDETPDLQIADQKLSRSPRNPFEWSTKRSGKVLDDTDDSADFLVHDEKQRATSISSLPHFHSLPRPPSSHIGQWTAGVVGGGSSKLQAIQKWFKSESVDGKDMARRRGDFTELASVSVRDLVKAIGGSSHDGRGNGNLPPIRSSSPISISSIGESSSKSLDIDSRKSDLLSGETTRARIGSDSDHSSQLNEYRIEHHTPRKQMKRTITVAMDPHLCMSPKKTLSRHFSESHTSDTKFVDLQNPSKLFEIHKEENENEQTITNVPTMPKRALPSRLAESFRAVFAAFLWHEGLVYDAMSCSSYLKFNPSLPKQNALMFTSDEIRTKSDQMTKEQRARQRYSVEVANAGNYLNIRPSTMETLNKSGQSSIQNRRNRKNNGQMTSPDIGITDSLKTSVKCPPALRCLVFLWEQISLNSIQYVEQNAANPESQSNNKETSVHEDSNVEEAESKNIDSRKNYDGSFCELCEVLLPIPVTYHMRLVHPGCGRRSKGKGYNSAGTYCEGWAGNCGEGGKGASSWYLMCENCRNKYMEGSRNSQCATSMAYPSTLLTNQKLHSISSLRANNTGNFNMFATMRENALFLLELSSTSSPILGNRRRPTHPMPSFNERTKSSESHLFSRFAARKRRKSDVLSSELIWQVPDFFLCGDTLSATYAKDAAGIDHMGYTKNSADMLSSDVNDSSTMGNGILINQSAASNATNTMSKFHRSVSMGQGWSTQTQLHRYSYQHDDSSEPKVIMRRKNKICDPDGSFSLCQPSENLRKLVPEEVFNLNAALSSYSKISSTLLTSKVPLENLDVKNENDIEEHSSPFDGDNQEEYVIISRTGDSSNPVDISLATTNDIIKQNISAFVDMPNLLSRNTLQFCLQKHNLDKLRYAMKRNLRIVTCRVYALQAMNWFIRSVTQTTCLHDLMWWFVSSLEPSNDDEITRFDEQALEHPIASVRMCDKLTSLLTHSFHTFLQSVADLTLLLPSGSSLQRLAIQCFGIRFYPSDHHFLHQSHVFGNISKILSRSDEIHEQQTDDMQFMFGDSDAFCAYGTKLHSLADMSGLFEVNASSRQAMTIALTDSSTETFWESDEEDRNKSKILEISLIKFDYICKMISIHVDNTRDSQNKVTNVLFYGGQSLGDTALIKSYDINSKTGSWISVIIPDDSYIHYRIELKGAETLRVRQIKLLGMPIISDDLVSKASSKLLNTAQIKHRSCEAETLRVFRLLTAQVFGKLILSNENGHEQNDDVASSGTIGALESNATSTSMLADSLDLREHMVGILFSRSKLSHLQKQVIVHIVHAIRRETLRAKEEWENANAVNAIDNPEASTSNAPLANSACKSDVASDSSRATDVYCFEMLSMVLALSGSSVGRSYLSNQHDLLKDLLTLLHTGSDRVQRQVTALLRRILPEITPEQFAELLHVHSMPPNDFSITSQAGDAFDMNRLGLLDIFLSIIAKSLQLQVKIKSANTANNAGNKQPMPVNMCNCIDFGISALKCRRQEIHPADEQSNAPNKSTAFEDSAMKKNDLKNMNQRWFLKGTINLKQSENIISLIRDMASGKLCDKWSMSERWSIATKAAIAESILNLTRLDEIYRTHDNCIKTATLWLALASLCVLDREHVERLSSGQWSKLSESRPLCSNHDDGITTAIIQCETCQSLCADCDRFLHLNRKTRNHRRTVCKEEEDAIRVELHEGCGRTKLFWLLALADSRTLKAIIEFRDGNLTSISGAMLSTVGRCRFCGAVGDSGLLAMGNVCADKECQEFSANACAKTKVCGHPCGGVINEKKCLPCLEVVCHKRENELAEIAKEPRLTQDADDMCMICFVEALSCAPAIQLQCGHVFHYHCCRTVLEKRWTGPRISFGFSLCPICKSDIAHYLLADLLDPIVELKADVKRKAVIRLEYEGIMQSFNQKDMATYAMDRYAYYVCFKCGRAYYGGEARCDAEMGDKYNPQELVCGGCSDVARAKMCPKHGTDFLEYKCRFCCSVAVYFCFGSTHFCDTCHDDFQRLTNIPRHKLPKCPAGPKAKQLMGEDCPLHVVHPPTGEEYALGCGICRNATTF